MSKSKENNKTTKKESSGNLSLSMRKVIDPAIFDDTLELPSYSVNPNKGLHSDCIPFTKPFLSPYSDKEYEELLDKKDFLFDILPLQDIVVEIKNTATQLNNNYVPSFKKASTLWAKACPTSLALLKSTLYSIEQKHGTERKEEAKEWMRKIYSKGIKKAGNYLIRERKPDGSISSIPVGWLAKEICSTISRIKSIEKQKQQLLNKHEEMMLLETSPLYSHIDMMGFCHFVYDGSIQEDNGSHDGYGTPMLQLLSFAKKRNDDGKTGIKSVSAGQDIHAGFALLKNAEQSIEEKQKIVLSFITPVTYSGNKRKITRINTICSLVSDIDDVSLPALKQYVKSLEQRSGESIDYYARVVPSILTLTASGIHLWWTLNAPIVVQGRNGLGGPLKDGAKLFQDALTFASWSKLNTNETPELLPLNQDYGIPGSMTKQYKPALKRAVLFSGEDIDRYEAYTTYTKLSLEDIFFNSLEDEPGVITYIREEISRRAGDDYDSLDIAKDVENALANKKKTAAPRIPTKKNSHAMKEKNKLSHQYKALGLNLSNNHDFVMSVRQAYEKSYEWACDNLNMPINEIVGLDDRQVPKTKGITLKQWLFPKTTQSPSPATASSLSKEETEYLNNGLPQELLLLILQGTSILQELVWFIGNANRKSKEYDIAHMIIQEGEKDPSAIDEMMPSDLLMIKWHSACGIDPSERRKKDKAREKAKKTAARRKKKGTKSYEDLNAERDARKGNMPPAVFSTWETNFKPWYHRYHQKIRYHQLLNDIQHDVTEGHRYLSLIELKKAALICNIAPSKLWDDAMTLCQKWNSSTRTHDIEPDEVEKALKLTDADISSLFNWDTAYKCSGIQSLSSNSANIVKKKEKIKQEVKRLKTETKRIKLIRFETYLLSIAVRNIQEIPALEDVSFKITGTDGLPVNTDDENLRFIISLSLLEAALNEVNVRKIAEEFKISPTWARTRKNKAIKHIIFEITNSYCQSKMSKSIKSKYGRSFLSGFGQDDEGLGLWYSARNLNRAFQNLSARPAPHDDNEDFDFQLSAKEQAGIIKSKNMAKWRQEAIMLVFFLLSQPSYRIKVRAIDKERTQREHGHWMGGYSQNAVPVEPDDDDAPASHRVPRYKTLTTKQMMSLMPSKSTSSELISSYDLAGLVSYYENETKSYSQAFATDQDIITNSFADSIREDESSQVISLYVYPNNSTLDNDMAPSFANRPSIMNPELVQAFWSICKAFDSLASLSINAWDVNPENQKQFVNQVLAVEYLTGIIKQGRFLHHNNDAHNRRIKFFHDNLQELVDEKKLNAECYRQIANNLIILVEANVMFSTVSLTDHFIKKVKRRLSEEGLSVRVKSHHRPSVRECNLIEGRSFHHKESPPGLEEAKAELSEKISQSAKRNSVS